MNLPYPHEIVDIQLDALTVRFAVIKEPEKLFDELILKGENHPEVIDENIPYWGELWPSALGLSRFLEQNKFLVKEKDVLELGCGLGLPGIVASLLGGKVVMSDYLLPALQFAEYNWKLNLNTPPRVLKLDWREPGNIQPAEVLIASDVAYESRSFLPLISAMKKLVTNTGTVIISEPDRAFASKFLEDVRKDFSLEKEKITVERNGRINNISIYILKRKSSGTR